MRPYITLQNGVNIAEDVVVDNCYIAHSGKIAKKCNNVIVLLDI